MFVLSQNYYMTIYIMIYFYDNCGLTGDRLLLSRKSLIVGN